ncbi:MAG: (2Fe-2S)-binding protein [Acholeplasmataceae bacterium]
MRIKEHPILSFPKRKTIPFSFNGKTIHGLEGDTIASALHANGILELSFSIKRGRSRGFYCAIGNCSSCHMTVDGVPNVKTCITPLVAGMDIRRQNDKGVIT